MRHLALALAMFALLPACSGGGGNGNTGGGSGGSTGGGSATGGGTGGTGGSGGGAATAPVFSDGGVPTALVGQAFTHTFTATGTAPITYGITAGTLPPGLSITPASGEYAGTATASGTFSFTVSATNAAGSATLPVMHEVRDGTLDGHVLLSGNRIAALSTGYPEGLGTPLNVTGLTANDTLVGIDRRPRNGQLYGLGIDAAGATQLYFLRVTPTGVVAKAIGTTGQFVDATATPITFSNTTYTYELDFNPVADRLRVVSSQGRNFRMNPNTGTFIDGDNGGAGGSVAGLNMDGAINGSTTTLAATAYTNSNEIAAVTTQYTADPTTDLLCIQSPPNAGTQTQCQMLVPALDAVLGFDIMPGVNTTMSNTPVVSGSGYLLGRATGASTETLYRVNLPNGGLAPGGALPMTGAKGLALAKWATPSVVVISGGSTIARADSATPGTVQSIVTTGLNAGEQVVGTDYSPTTGQLFGLGVNATANTATLYLMDPTTGVCTAIGTPGQIAFTTASATPVDLPAGDYGFDFNPTVDRIRVTTSTGLSFRVNPITGGAVDGDNGGAAGSVTGVNTDGTINGAVTGLDAVAYTNGLGDTVTTLYGLDSASNQLVIVNPPNAGTTGNALPVTLGGSPVDFSGASFDIPWTVRVATSNTAATGKAYAVLVVGGNTGLYTIELSTGVATSLGALTGFSNPSGLTVGTVGF